MFTGRYTVQSARRILNVRWKRPVCHTYGTALAAAGARSAPRETPAATVAVTMSALTIDFMWLLRFSGDLTVCMAYLRKLASNLA